MQKHLKSSLLFLVAFCLISCNFITDNYPEHSKNNIITNRLSEELSYKFVRPEQLPAQLVSALTSEAKELSDKASKRRGIDFFHIAANPFGIQVCKDAFILNYLGVSENTEDLNIEMHALHTPGNNSFLFNYSGPVTRNVQNLNQTEKISNSFTVNNHSIEFELIYGLPSESIQNAFSHYWEQLTLKLKQIYRYQELKFDDAGVFVYAVHHDGELEGFFFESHHNFLSLGSRKYADLQFGVVIATDTEIRTGYALVAFNPKFAIDAQPKYNYIESSPALTLVEIGEY